MVESRITPIGKKIEEESDKEHADFNPKDLILDRVWITIPLETTVRQALNIEELESRFLVGYEAGLIDDTLFVQPCRVTGVLTLLEEGPEQVVIDMDILVQSKDLTPWRVEWNREIPVTLVGNRAKSIQSTSTEQWTSLGEIFLEALASSEPGIDTDQPGG